MRAVVTVVLASMKVSVLVVPVCLASSDCLVVTVRGLLVPCGASSVGVVLLVTLRAVVTVWMLVVTCAAASSDGVCGASMTGC